MGQGVECSIPDPKIQRDVCPFSSFRAHSQATKTLKIQASRRQTTENACNALDINSKLFQGVQRVLNLAVFVVLVVILIPIPCLNHNNPIADRGRDGACLELLVLLAAPPDSRANDGLNVTRRALLVS